MTQPVVLQRPNGETQDGIGEPTITYAERTTVMYLQPRSGREAKQDRNTPIGDWRGVGRIDVDFTSWSRVLYAGHVLDIVAPPRLVHNPSRNGASHYSLDLQEVDAPAVVVVAPAPPAYVGGFDDGYDDGFDV